MRWHNNGQSCISPSMRSSQDLFWAAPGVGRPRSPQVLYQGYPGVAVTQTPRARLRLGALEQGLSTGQSASVKALLVIVALVAVSDVAAAQQAVAPPKRAK